MQPRYLDVIFPFCLHVHWERKDKTLPEDQFCKNVWKPIICMSTGQTVSVQLEALDRLHQCKIKTLIQALTAVEGASERICPSVLKLAEIYSEIEMQQYLKFL